MRAMRFNASRKRIVLDHSATGYGSRPAAADYGFGILQRQPQKRNPGGPGLREILERETRLELATPTLARSCSTN